MTSIEAAAWVQAVGSVAAILAAVWIGWRSDRRARDLIQEEHHRQGFIVAHTVGGSLLVLAETFEDRISTLKLAYRQVPPNGTVYFNESTVGRKYQVDISLIDRNHVLMLEKSVGALAMDALDTMAAYNRLVVSSARNALIGDVNADDVRAFYGTLLETAGVIAPALYNVQRNLSKQYGVRPLDDFGGK